MILFVHPNGNAAYQALAGSATAIETPVWAAMIAGYCRGSGIDAEILDANAEGLTPEAAGSRVAEIDPEIVCVVAYGSNPNASTQVMPSVIATCEAIRQAAPGTRIAVVGGHAAALPERTLRETGADWVACDEGVESIVRLVTLSPRPPCILPPAPLVDVPRAAYELLIGFDGSGFDPYRSHNWHSLDGSPRGPYASVYTTLGCPAHCAFCCIQAPFREGERVSGYAKGVNSYRRKPPRVVLSEIDWLVDHGVVKVKIADELFTANRDHVREICEGLALRSYIRDGSVRLWCDPRVDTLCDGLPEIMRSAGIDWCCLGIESASREVRKAVRKGYAQDRIYEARAACRSAGICNTGNYLFGLPDDTIETMRQTIDLMLDLKTEWVNLYCCLAIPGSRLYEEKVAEGWTPPPWAAYSQLGYECDPLGSKMLTGAEVLRFRDEAFVAYMQDAGYREALRATLGDGAVAAVADLGKVPIRRRILE